MASERDEQLRAPIGRNQIAESRDSSPIMDLLSTKKGSRKRRLALAKEGAKNLLAGTRAINRAKQRQSTDHNN